MSDATAHVRHFRTLARYNAWVNERLYALAQVLTEEERRRDLRAFFRSVHGTLNHLLVGDRFLLGRLRAVHHDSVALAGTPVLDDYEPARELYADLAELAAERVVTDRAILAWTEELTEEVLGRMPGGRPFWSFAAHFFNHQTHHRGQLTTLFMQLGHDPGVTDIVALPAARSENNSEGI